ncbi:MAG: S26 family signal peptidase [Nanoarchaeota archaeon]
MSEILEKLKKFWNFLKKDTWQSWIVSMILLIIIIKGVLFPTLSFITSSPLPLVVVESCSMYHSSDFENWWTENEEWYESRYITKEQFKKFIMKNGLNKGDIIVIWGRSEPKVGDIIIFQTPSSSEAKHPIIHRVVSLNPLGTKGDNGKTNPGQIKDKYGSGIDESDIKKENVLGKSIFKIPALGWIKLIFFEPFRQPSARGFCK